MDSLDIEGKEYISARRAGREYGYTSDYIGQLVRKGSLDGKKVGRAWYVSQESLSAYGEVLEAEKRARSEEMKEEVSRVTENKPIQAIHQPPLKNPYEDYVVRSMSTVEEPREVTVKDVDAVFGMRYLSDEDSMLPSLHTRMEETKKEEFIPIRTMERDSSFHSERASSESGRISPIAPRNVQTRDFGGIFRPIVVGIAVCFVLVLVGSSIFMDKTIAISDTAVTAGVSFSWAK